MPDDPTVTVGPKETALGVVAEAAAAAAVGVVAVVVASSSLR